jgi:N-methylhydantoinase B
MTSHTDPITVAVIRGALESICDEMDTQLIHAALSPIISETNDCAHGIYHPVSGETIAQGRFGLPVFMANMQFSVQSVIDKANSKGGFRPGDVWIMNDPYLGGSHLNDINLILPVFHGDELFAILANTGHWMDIGGAIPGGWIPGATNIHEEGLLIPPVRLYSAGELNDGVIDLITANVRLPEMIFGDMTAMSSALRTGETRLRGLIDRYGAETVSACQEEMITRAEREMRSYIEEIPDGTYEQVDYLDNDGVTDERHEFRVTITVRGSEMHLDFTGTSAAAQGPINLAKNTTVSSVYVALKHIFPDVPVNGGTFRPVTYTVPPKSIISASYPNPVSGYLEVVGRVIDLIFGALAPALPEKVPAPFFGTTGVVTVAGHHPHRDDYVVGVFPYAGGYGGSAHSDGQAHGTPPQSMANFMSLEVAEHRFPLRFDYFAMREDSGGAGEHRGGTGTSYGFTVWSELLSSVLGDRVDHTPFGVNGGHAAAGNTVRFRTGGDEWTPELRSKYAGLALKPGDSVMVTSPGGGGFGNPLDRSLDAVERDLNLGLVSRTVAEDTYGVVVAEVTTLAGREQIRLDPDKTAERRQRLRQEPAPDAPNSTDNEGAQK